MLRLWDALELYLSGVLAIVATTIVIYAAFMRYVFRSAPSWSLEVVIYLMIWTAFVMASHLMREGGHVGADFLVGRLSFAVRRAIDFATSLLALVFVLVVLWQGALHVVDTYEFGARSTTALQFPLWLAYAAVPFGAFLLALRLLQRLYLLVRRPASVVLIHGDTSA